MEEGNRSEQFTYWKHPWGKWLVLAAAVIPIINLWIMLRFDKEVKILFTWIAIPTIS